MSVDGPRANLPEAHLLEAICGWASGRRGLPDPHSARISPPEVLRLR